ncbi:Glycosyltransferase, GT2 family [Lentzea albidocapillata subsp. violacea]|uniref:Glycosyltransferase, GT2 family n=1 Tax=Lentzea albidocapillata subsp. violacea TaxID=128104 RepID=A0A1G8WQQ5_9PSEU|nr:glycosyltransferase [Lentzea albidocapillata]SDJ79950.1 Glycosyltransferase, GT2 family [Lentzea albidocapillata subsp. violacea]
MSAVSTVVVVTWRGRDHITACLDALRAQKSPHRTIIVDNASDDGTAELISGHEVVRLPRNRGYAGGLAAVLGMVDTPYVAWLNDDAAPDPSWLTELESALDGEPGAAAATSSILLMDGSTQSVGVALTADGHGRDVMLAGREVFGFCGGAALLRTAELKAVGGVPASFFCYYEDTDTAWRLRLAGHRVISVGPARVRHRHGASTRPGSALFHRWNERNRLLMLLRCAPASAAFTQLARFLVITALLPFRGNVPDAANFRFGLRTRVLAEVLLRLPATLVQRLMIKTAVSRGSVWRDWAGR